MKNRLLFLCSCYLPVLLWAGESILLGPDSAQRVKAYAKANPEIWEDLQAQLKKARTAGFGFQQENADHSMQPTWAVGEALEYLRTGDADHAEQALDYVWAGMYSVLPNKNQWRQSHRVAGIALTYDLCGEAWPEAFQKNVRHFLQRQTAAYSNRLDHQERLNTWGRYTYGGETENELRRPDHLEGLRYRVAGALAAMALEKQPPEPYKPTPPDRAKTIPSLKEIPNIPGLPVVTLEDGLMFRNWLGNGPFPLDVDDPLKELGGFAKARPVPGTRVTLEGESLDFRPYQTSFLEGANTFYPRNCMRYFVSSTGKGFPAGKRLMTKWKAETELRNIRTAVTLFTVWKVTEDTTIRAFPNVFSPSRGVRMWLNGEEVMDEDVLQVSAGYVPVMIYMPITGGYARQQPQLQFYSQELYQKEQKGLEEAQRWANQHRGWLKRVPSETADHLKTYLTKYVPESGWQSWHMGIHLPLFLQAWNQASGENLVAETGLTALPELAGMLTPFPESNEARKVVGMTLPLQAPGAAQAQTQWIRNELPPGLRTPMEILAWIASDRPEISASSSLERVWASPGDERSWVRDEIPAAGTRSGIALGFQQQDAIHGNRQGLGLTVLTTKEGTQASWLRPGFGKGDERTASANIPRVKGYVNSAPAQPVHPVRAQGSESIQTLRTSPLKPVKGNAKGDQPILQRSVWTHFPSGKPEQAVWVVADQYENVNLDQVKMLQVQPGGQLRGAEWNYKTNSVIFGPERGMEMRMQVIAPRKLTVSKEAHNKEGTRGMYRVLMDQEIPKNRELKVIDPGHMLDGGLEELTLGLESDLNQQKRQAQVETVTLISVFSLRKSRGTHPDIRWKAPHLQVGSHSLKLEKGVWTKTP